MTVITCEQVSCGHPDKICDQIADAVLTDCLRHDPSSRVAIEVLIKDSHIVIAGELTTRHTPDYRKLVDSVFERIGKGILGYNPDEFEIEVLVSHQSPDIAQGVDTGGAGDQGIMYGYATCETPEMLPIPFVVATRFLQNLRKVTLAQTKDVIFLADAKAQVSYDYESQRITAFQCSVQHTESADRQAVQSRIYELMEQTARELGLNTDFDRFVNETGRFVIGGSFADCGVTGRKLACDTYGGVGRIGGGALSGKDASKVDRSGAYMARKVARDIVKAGFADKCEIQLSYAIGVANPLSFNVETFGTAEQPYEEIEKFIIENYDLTPKGIIRTLDLLHVDYNLTSAYGHFGKIGLSWEE